mmetsp:Transcript_56795/g.164783  ORF Transcript_56795/g.164783 Transcript_56795/m.164783 type:complete len:342 (+) Transcript_56795:70-1095(+)
MKLTALAVVGLVGLQKPSMAPARRTRAAGGAELNPAVIATSVCVAGSFENLVNTQDFKAIHDLSIWCPDGHANAAKALAFRGLAHETPEVREKSVEELRVQIAALEEEDDPVAQEFVEFFVESLRDDAEVVRQEAVQALKDLGMTAIERQVHAIASMCADALAEAAVDDEAKYVRTPAAEALSAVAIRALGSGRRDLAADILGKLEVRVFQDGENLVRAAVARALGQVAIAALERSDDSIAGQSLAALAEKGLGDGDVLVRWMAVDALGKLARRAKVMKKPDTVGLAMSALKEKALGDEADHIKRLAKEILKQLKGKDDEFMPWGVASWILGQEQAGVNSA